MMVIILLPHYCTFQFGCHWVIDKINVYEKAWNDISTSVGHIVIKSCT